MTWFPVGNPPFPCPPPLFVSIVEHCAENVERVYGSQPGEMQAVIFQQAVENAVAFEPRHGKHPGIPEIHSPQAVCRLGFVGGEYAVMKRWERAENAVGHIEYRTCRECAPVWFYA